MSKQIKKLAGLELAQELFRLQLRFCILAPPYSILWVLAVLVCVSCGC